MTEDLEDIPLYTFVNAGLALYNEGEEFEAHELWEYAWKAEVGRRKLTLQALIQIAAAVHKHKTAVLRGTEKLLIKAADKIDEILEGGRCFLGVDLIALKKEVTRSLEEASSICRGESRSFSPPKLPPFVSESGFVYLHGFASSPLSKKAREIAPRIEEEGFRIRVPDLNERDFTGLTLTRAIECAKRFIFDKSILIGSSMGAQVALRVAEKDERVKALVLLAPAFDLGGSMDRRYSRENIERWREQDLVPVAHYGTGKVEHLAFGFYEDAKRYTKPPRLSVPTFVLHGRDDETIPIEEVRRQMEGYEETAEFEEVDDDHTLAKTWRRGLEAALQFADALNFQQEAEPVTTGSAHRLLRRVENAAEE